MRMSKRSRVYIAGGASGTITAFDIEKSLIKEVYKFDIKLAANDLATHPSTPKKMSSPILPLLVDLDEEQNKAGGSLGRFTSSSPMERSAGSPDQAIRALAMSAHAVDGQEPRHPFYVSAGPDWKIRFWDSLRAESCSVVSGLDVDEDPPFYSMQKVADAVIIAESTAGSSTAVSQSPTTKKARGTKSVVSLQQQSMMKGHRDAVMDVALVESPYGMIVSVDRSGMIYIWS